MLSKAITKVAASSVVGWCIMRQAPRKVEQRNRDQSTVCSPYILFTVFTDAKATIRLL